MGRIRWGKPGPVVHGKLALIRDQREAVNVRWQQIGFREKSSDSSIVLAEILERKPLTEHLLGTNTFFHAKIGFYERILSLLDPYSVRLRIHALEEIPSLLFDSGRRLIVMPSVATTEELNVIIARVLEIASSANKVVPVWLIAPFMEVSKTLLVSFKNFFVLLYSKEELATLLSVIDVPQSHVTDTMRNLLKDNEPWLKPAALFVTTYSEMASGKQSIAIYEIKR